VKTILKELYLMNITDAVSFRAEWSQQRWHCEVIGLDVGQIRTGYSLTPASDVASRLRLRSANRHPPWSGTGLL